MTSNYDNHSALLSELAETLITGLGQAERCCILDELQKLLTRTGIALDKAMCSGQSQDGTDEDVARFQKLYGQIIRAIEANHI